MPHLYPSRLHRLAQAFIAEEATSSLRHDLRNKLAAARNAAFYIRRKAESGTTLMQDDSRIETFFELIERELTACDEMMAARRLPRPNGGILEVSQSVVAWVESIAPAPKVSVSIPEPLSGRINICPDELELALSCLLENAIEASSPPDAIEVTCGARSGKLTVEVVDRGPGFGEAGPEEALKAFFTTKPGHLGLGLNVAGRVAARWRGSLELENRSEGGVRAALVIPVIA